MRAAYQQIDGQPGAAAAVVQSIRGGNWAVTPAVAVNKSQDLITRVVGKPGVVLISEGPSSRVVPMLANERKRTARWLPDVPIYEIQVGNDEGQVAASQAPAPARKAATQPPRWRDHRDAPTPRCARQCVELDARPQGADADERPAGSPPSLGSRRKAAPRSPVFR